MKAMPAALLLLPQSLNRLQVPLENEHYKRECNTRGQ